MEFREFCDYVAENISRHLPEVEIAEQPVTREVTKNNAVTVTGLMIRSSENMDICPNIYLEYYFRRYRLEDMSLEEVLDEIADEYRRASGEMGRIQTVTSLEGWDQDINRVVPRLINYDRNRELVDGHPHVFFQDLAVVFRIVVGFDETGVSSVMVSDSMLERMGMTVEELLERALSNYRKMFPVMFKRLDELLVEMMGIDDPVGMDMRIYVLSNKQNVNGATVLLDNEVLQKAMEKLEGGYTVLPSSVHECLLVPDDFDGNIEYMKDMVREINQSVVSEVDFLSDTLYHFDGAGLTMVNPPEWMRVAS